MRQHIRPFTLLFVTAALLVSGVAGT